MRLIIDIPDNEILVGWYTYNDGINQYHKAKTLGKPNYIPLDDVISHDYATMIAHTDYEKVKERGCNTCKHQLKFMCTEWKECKNKSKYEPREQEPKSPCDLCRYDYMDDYCGECPAMAKGEWE